MKSIVCDVRDVVLRQLVTTYLKRMGHRPVCWESAANPREYAQLAIVECARDQATETAIKATRLFGLQAIAVVRESSEDLAIWALRSGFTDYLPCPLAWETFRLAIEKQLAPFSEATASDDAAVCPLAGILGTSPQICEVRRQIVRIGMTESTVLVLGETGTGKELVASAIHASSKRRNGPFVAVNCAAIPESLIESELFGHQRGSFTGAVTSEPGLMRQAKGGTLFLDEVGELSAPAQAKLLRAIETRTAAPVGGGLPLPLDIRIVAATNQNLEAMALANSFRRDLFYRLNVVRIELPPLRERVDDVLVLIEHFLTEFRRKFGGRSRRFPPHTIDILRRYDWPGNIRELCNLVEASFVQGSADNAEYLDLPKQFGSLWHSAAPLPERQRLVEALYETHWNISLAAKRLKWSRMTVYRKIATYAIARQAASNASA